MMYVFEMCMFKFIFVWVGVRACITLKTYKLIIII